MKMRKSASPGMTMRYAHLSAQHKKTAIDTLGSLFKSKDDSGGKVGVVV